MQIIRTVDLGTANTITSLTLNHDDQILNFHYNSIGSVQMVVLGSNDIHDLIPRTFSVRTSYSYIADDEKYVGSVAALPPPATDPLAGQTMYVDQVHVFEVIEDAA